MNGLNLDDDDDEWLDDDDDSLVSGNLSISQSILSDIEAGKPISIASTLLAYVPQNNTSDEQLIQDYPADALDKDDENPVKQNIRSSDRSLLSAIRNRKALQKQSSQASIDFEIEIKMKEVDKEMGTSSSDTNIADIEESVLLSGAGDKESQEEKVSEPTVDSTTEPDTNADPRDFRRTFAEKQDPEVATSQDEDPYGILEMNMFLTAKNEANKIAGHPFVQVGRPDLIESFIQMKKEAIAHGERRVAVCVCAPERLVLLCKKACVKYSDSDVRFDLHEEIFG